MKYFNLMVLFTFSFNLIAGEIYDEIEAGVMKKDYFGIEGKQTEISPTSFCIEASYEETTRNPSEVNNEEYKNAKLLYHVHYMDCVEKSVRIGVRFVSPELEKKFCDKESLDAEVADTIARIKAVKLPMTGKFANVDLKRFIFTMELIQKDQRRSCERYYKRPGSPKLKPKSLGAALSNDGSIDGNDSARSKFKEKSGSPVATPSKSSDLGR